MLILLKGYQEKDSWITMKAVIITSDQATDWLSDQTNNAVKWNCTVRRNN